MKSLKEQFEESLVTALEIGITVKEYWDMTPSELESYMQAYTNRTKEEHQKALVMNYNLATMVSSFVGLSLNGKQPPSIYDMFPDCFTDEQREKATDTVAIAKFQQLVATVNAQRSTQK